MPNSNSHRFRTPRRRFLHASVAAFAAPCWWGSRTASADGTSAASDTLTIGCIGLGARGRHFPAQISRKANVAMVCDLDSGRIEKVLKQFTKVTGSLATRQNAGARKLDVIPEGVDEYRRLLDNDSIDAVMIATPDHWHAKIAIEAMQAGKDVYCEKPLSLTIEEGKQIDSVVKQTGRVFQVGTQQRSMKQFITAIALVHAGRIGKVRKVTVCVDRAPYSADIPAAEPPANLDWDRWLGQCPEMPFRIGPNLKKWSNGKSPGDGGDTASNGHYEFRWWYQFSAGKLTDWGAHHIDICQWLLNQNGQGQGVLKVTPTLVDHPVDSDDVGNPLQSSRYNVPTRFEFRADFPDGVEVAIVSDGRNGLLVEGEQGRFFVNRGGIQGKPVEELKDNPLPIGAIDKIRGAGRSWSHTDDFLDCIKSRRTPVSDAASHHRALTTAHLCGIAARLNRPIEWDPVAQQIVGDKVAQAMQSRQQRKGYEIIT